MNKPRAFWIIAVPMVMLSLLLASFSRAATNFTELHASDVTTRSFTVNWRVDVAATAGLQVFSDTLATQPVTGATYYPQFTESNSSALATGAENAGILRVRIDGLQPNTAYFFRTVSTPKSTGVPALFPLSGPLPSVVTARQNFPESNESIAAQIQQNDSVTAATGSLMLLRVQGSPWPLSQMVGDGFEPNTAAINLTNLYDDTSNRNRLLAGGETATLQFMGGTMGQYQLATVIPNNNGLGETELNYVVTLQPRLDTDNDGMPDHYENANGLNPAANDAATDADSDGLANGQEFLRGTNPNVSDSDGDGYSDGAEVSTHGTLPTQYDTDRDGISDQLENTQSNTDPLQADSDGDGVNDGLEVSAGTDPNDPSDTPVLDSDSDSVPDNSDNCATLPNPGQADNDNDSQGDICDDDDDNDGISDLNDNAPLNANPGQEDGDADNVGDAADNCPLEENSTQSNNDNDGQGNVCDADDDNDGINDFTQPAAPSNLAHLFASFVGFVNTTLPVTSHPQAYASIIKFDTATSTSIVIGYFNLTTRVFTPQTLTPAQQAVTGMLAMGLDTNHCNCINVKEGDTITIETDQGVVSAVFPAISAESPATNVMFVAVDGSTYLGYIASNNTLSNLFQSGQLPQPLDNCQFTANPLQEDVDSDGVGDVCDVSPQDLDGDGVLNSDDNCPNTHNTNQSNLDGDLLGDVCDADNDNDSIDDVTEVSVLGSNPFSADTDSDGVTDAQEDFDFDGRSNQVEVLAATNPFQPTIQLRQGLNFFSYPVTVPASTSAFSLLDQLGGTGVVNRIQRYDTATTTLATAEFTGGIHSGTDFPIVANEGYFVEMAQDFALEFSGAVTCNDLSLSAGVNAIGFSCVPTNASAYGMLAVLGGEGVVASLQRYNRQTGRYETATYSNGYPVGVNFPVTNGEAYLAHMNSANSQVTFSIGSPSVIVTSHTDGEIVHSSPVTIVGEISEVSSQVTVNGISAPVTLVNSVPTFTATGVALAEGSNSITVVARGSNNLVTTQTFSLTLATPPVLTLALPVNGMTTQGSPYRVRGSISDATASVTVNGIAATKTGNNFEAAVPLTVGANTLTILATGSNTAQAQTSLTIHYQPVALSVQAGSQGTGTVTFVTTPALFSQLGGRQYTLSTPSGVTYADQGQTSVSPDQIQINYSLTVNAATAPGVYNFGIPYRFRDKDNTSQFIFEDEIDFVLTVTPLSGPPVISISSHSNGATVYASPVTISGALNDSSATVTVNGQPATISGNSYSVSLNLVEGPNTVTVIATNSFGSTTQIITLNLDTGSVPTDIVVTAGSSAGGTHDSVTTPALFSQIAFYSYSVDSIPAQLTYTPTGASLIAPATVRLNYNIAAAAGTTPGIYTVTLTYHYLNSGSNELFSDTFDVVVEVQ